MRLPFDLVSKRLSSSLLEFFTSLTPHKNTSKHIFFHIVLGSVEVASLYFFLSCRWDVSIMVILFVSPIMIPISLLISLVSITIVVSLILILFLPTLISALPMIGKLVNLAWFGKN